MSERIKKGMLVRICRNPSVTVHDPHVPTRLGQIGRVTHTETDHRTDEVRIHVKFPSEETISYFAQYVDEVPEANAPVPSIEKGTLVTIIGDANHRGEIGKITGDVRRNPYTSNKEKLLYGVQFEEQDEVKYYDTVYLYVHTQNPLLNWLQ